MEAEGSTRRCDSEQLFSPEGLLAPNLLDVVGGGGVSPRGCTAPGPMGTRTPSSLKSIFFTEIDLPEGGVEAQGLGVRRAAPGAN